MRQILFAGVEPDERAPLAGGWIAKRATKGRIPVFKRIDHAPLCRLGIDRDLAVAAGKLAQVSR